MGEGSGAFSADARIVVLTGAGISAESGLETFRDPDGIWARYDMEEVATPGAFRRDPALVHRFYNERRRQLAGGEIEPNPAHRALARLEREWSGTVTLITQNIDDLHERAGSVAPIHMHGEMLKARCVRSGRVSVCLEDLSVETRCACCGEAGTMRPHVVWFGEIPLGMDRIDSALRACDLFIAIGTSGQIYPAAGFAAQARGNGRARAVELNLEPTALTSTFDERIHGPAGEVVPAYVESLLDRN